MIQGLISRGVRPGNAQSLVADHPADRITAAVGWFDQQQAGSVGAGVLVAAVREGRKPTPRSSTAAAGDNSAGWARLWSWCAEHFQDLVDEHGDLHPAVVGAVWLLGGPDRVSLPEQDGWIRSHVRYWDRLFIDDTAEVPA